MLFYFWFSSVQARGSFLWNCCLGKFYMWWTVSNRFLYSSQSNHCGNSPRWIWWRKSASILFVCERWIQCKLLLGSSSWIIFYYETTSNENILTDSLQDFELFAQLGQQDLEFYLSDPALPDPFKLTPTQRSVVAGSVSALTLIFLLWVLLMVCAAKVRDRKSYEKSEDLSWKKEPIKKLCWKLQDLIPSKKKSTSSSFFKAKKHLGILLSLFWCCSKEIWIFSSKTSKIPWI